MDIEIDVEKLRSELMDYYGSAAFVGFPYALGDVVAMEEASPEQLVERAKSEGIDLRRFAVLDYDDDYDVESDSDKDFWL